MEDENIYLRNEIHTNIREFVSCLIMIYLLIKIWSGEKDFTRKCLGNDDQLKLGDGIEEWGKAMVITIMLSVTSGVIISKISEYGSYSLWDD